MAVLMLGLVESETLMDQLEGWEGQWFEVGDTVVRMTRLNYEFHQCFGKYPKLYLMGD